MEMGTGRMLEPEMEAEADRGNKYSALHPWHESVVRRKRCVDLVGIRSL